MEPESPSIMKPYREYKFDLPYMKKIFIRYLNFADGEFAKFQFRS